MMIRAAITALLLGTFDAMAGATNENLRGNTSKQMEAGAAAAAAANPRERVLMDMDMNIGLGEMVCKERVPIDGTVVCTFRTMPPADLTTANVLHDCLYDSRKRSNFCLSAEVYRNSYMNVPINQQQQVVPVQQQQQQQQQPPQQQPPQPVQQNPVAQVGAVGVCPTAAQATGMACGQYIPRGSRTTSCYFGRTQCNCALSDDPTVTEAWTCRPVPDDAVPPPMNGQQQQQQQQPPAVATPNPGVTTVVTRPVNNPVTGVGVGGVTTVTATAQNIVVNEPDADVPTGSPTPVRAGYIRPKFVNAAGCPTLQPNDGADCTWGQSCSYYNEDETAAFDCLCDGSYNFQCIPSRHPGLFPPSPSSF